MEDYLTRIDEDLWCPIKSGPYQVNDVEAVGTVAKNENVTIDQLNKEANDKRFIQVLRGALRLMVYSYIRGCKTTQYIWSTLKEKFHENERTKKSLITQG